MKCENLKRMGIAVLVLGFALTAPAQGDGPELDWATYYGDDFLAATEAIAVAPDGSVIAVGFTMEVLSWDPFDFNIDAFIVRFSADGTLLLNEMILDGSGIEGAFGVSVDDAGIITVTGQTDSADFPAITSDALQDTIAGSAGGFDAADGFVIQLTPDFELLYGTYLGGSREEAITDMAVDKKGAIVVCGYTRSNDFPTTDGALQGAREADREDFDAFVARIVPGAKNQLTYSTYVGGTGDDCDGKATDASQEQRLLRQAVAVMPNGNIVVAGMTWSDDFPVTEGALQTEHSEYGDEYADNADIYVTVLNPTGSGRRAEAGETQLVYSTYLGGTGRDLAEDLVVRDSAKISLLGLSQSADFPVTRNAFQGELLGMQDAVVVQIRTQPNIPPKAQLAYSTYFGGTGRDAGNGMYMTKSGDIVISGPTNSDDFPLTDGSTIQGGFDIFVSRLDTSRKPDKQLVFSTLFGGSGGEQLSVGPRDDGSTTVYIGGSTGSDDLPGVEGSWDDSLTGLVTDAFVARYYIGSMGNPKDDDDE